ncbi:homocysteine S-methyltransferase [Mycolicibacterium duvalii]|uniref:Homocysteine S-methyltransferase n=1 Tax=Mycolicibacterium duvalii TaxID=39688 RepID=A0A7I7JXV4_9MYCO|nr:homocysteine S-methyltransferase family protein [Mycolicibacterium duvalii]MCV7369957.1 homocysteine S-methyltransferase family protein [Mycolicibacterium duvalii]PEG38359.1 homocysteine S-methyltransferase [Mycolicibacterium duvalii]BBX15942.1 homocysteine S-methyltransferase [Mycolicibacterium duvalii]
MLFVTDGGLETELVFHDGRDLPGFAAFPLLETPDGRARLQRYYDGYLDIARRHRTGFVVETPTWRANPDWAAQLGYSVQRLDELNRAAVELAEEVRAAAQADGVTAVVSGCIGPRGDGYDPGAAMTTGEAEDYHATQIGTYAATSADRVTAITMTNTPEAVGVVRAAAAAGITSAVSFTVETDGRLPTGQPLHEAVEQTDAETAAAAEFFMVNCAHPTHFAAALDHDGPWLRRLGGLRANASTLSHAELDVATELDDGDPDDLAAAHVALRHRLPAVAVLGGCCGTDARHVAALCAAWEAN